MDRPLGNEPMVVHLHLRGGAALCGSQGGEGVYHGEGVTCPQCKERMQYDQRAKDQIAREPKPATPPESA